MQKIILVTDFNILWLISACGAKLIVYSIYSLRTGKYFISRLYHIGHGFFFKFSLIYIYNKTKTERFATKLCNFTILDTIVHFYQMNNFVSTHLKILTFSLLSLHGKIELLFSGVQRHKYCSYFKSNLYVVTYYKDTSLFWIFFFLSWII